MAFVIFLLVKFINKIAELGNRKDKEKTPEEPAKPATKICPYCKSGKSCGRGKMLSLHF